MNRSRLLVAAALAFAACNSTGLGLDDHLDGGQSDAHRFDASGTDSPPPPVDLAQSCPSGQPSTQTVTIEIANASSSDRWVVTQGQYCLTFDIDQLTLALGYRVICEGPAPPTPMATYYTHLAPGATTSLTWDATALELCEQSVDCATRGWPNAGVQTYEVGVSMPVSSGSYTASVAWEPSAPSMPGCFAQPNGDVRCNPNFGPPFGGGSSIQQLCMATSQAQASFTLPPTGDTTVAIAIP
jgi:hypothetical protein